MPEGDVQQALTAGTFTDPGNVDSALRTVKSAASVDDTLGDADLVRLAYSLRGRTRANVKFFTAPVLSTGMEDALSVVYLDDVSGERMWEYLRNDSLAQNAGEFSDETLPAVSR